MVLVACFQMLYSLSALFHTAIEGHVIFLTALLPWAFIIPSMFLPSHKVWVIEVLSLLLYISEAVIVALTPIMSLIIYDATTQNHTPIPSDSNKAELERQIVHESLNF